jgi:glutamate:GABA antiporter
MSKKALGLFQLVMINVIAVASLRSLPFSAVYGFSLVFFYALAAILFFFPAALVSAELGTGWPNTGGIYVWVREAFGKKWSLLVIWLNWTYNVIWYPTILALIAGTITYLFNPDWASNKWYMAGSVLVLFWVATWVNLHGMKISSWISTIGAIVGTLVPMVFIISLGISWLFLDKPLTANFFANNFIPDLSSENNLAFLTNVLFALLGLEMSATHAAEMRNPQRDYPRALGISAILIWTCMVLASLGIAMVVSPQELNLATGLMQAFEIFLKAFHLTWIVPVIALCVILGGISAVSTWIIGPTKGVMVACHDSNFPSFWLKKNKHNVPSHILICQAVFVSILSLAFIFFPTVNSSFWFLSVITAQLALIVYIFLFLSALKLHYHKPHVPRSFRIPGKNIGMWIVCVFGIFSSVSVILLGFIPPAQIPIQNVFLYEGLLIFCMAIFCAIPFFLIRKYQK